MLPLGFFVNALLLAYFATSPCATDQPNPEVWDEVDNEIVDDEACSEETPADKSEQAANKKEVLLELGQKLIVKKGMYRIIMHGSSLKLTTFSPRMLHVTCM